MPVSIPPTSLDVFIFYFLGVGPPCCSIVCQFWLCEEAQCVYLRRHLGIKLILKKVFVLLIDFHFYSYSVGFHYRMKTETSVDFLCQGARWKLTCK